MVSSNTNSPTWIERFLKESNNVYLKLPEIMFDFDEEMCSRLSLQVPYFDETKLYMLGHQSSVLSPKQCKLLDYSAKILYIILHGMYVQTVDGCNMFIQKYFTEIKGEPAFGYCPRIFCSKSPLVPVGLSEYPEMYPIKLLCYKCMDIYNAFGKLTYIDGAAFPPSFPYILFNVHYDYFVSASKINEDMRILQPKAFGFKQYTKPPIPETIVSDLYIYNNAKREFSLLNTRREIMSSSPFISTDSPKLPYCPPSMSWIRNLPMYTELIYAIKNNYISLDTENIDLNMLKS